MPQLEGSRSGDMKKAIILSAGQGSRLGHLTDDRPKCLIEFNGRTLLDRQLDALAANGVEEAVVVTGFRDDQIEAALKRRGDIGPRVRTVSSRNSTRRCSPPRSVSFVRSIIPQAWQARGCATQSRPAE